MTDRPNQRDNRNKPNRGQDEKTHEYTDGTDTVTLTQRQFRDQGLAQQGYEQVEDVEVPTEETPA